MAHYTMFFQQVSLIFVDQFSPRLGGPLLSLILISKPLAENEKSFQCCE